MFWVRPVNWEEACLGQAIQTGEGAALRRMEATEFWNSAGSRANQTNRSPLAGGVRISAPSGSG